MTYSYTQISQYLTCPRHYQHRYLEGWKEKDTRAAMLFGREDPRAILFSEWSASQNRGLHHCNGDSWVACCDKASCCWTVSVRTIVSRFTSLDGICRSSSPANCREVRFCRPCRCHRQTRRRALPAGVENLFEPIPGRA